MARYGDDLISPRHKDAFVQALLEGKTVALGRIDDPEYPGFWVRVAAKLIDLFVIAGCAFILAMAVALIYRFQSSEVHGCSQQESGGKADA